MDSPIISENEKRKQFYASLSKKLKKCEIDPKLLEEIIKEGNSYPNNYELPKKIFSAVKRNKIDKPIELCQWLIENYPSPEWVSRDYLKNKEMGIKTNGIFFDEVEYFNNFIIANHQNPQQNGKIICELASKMSVTSISSKLFISEYYGFYFKTYAKNDEKLSALLKAKKPSFDEFETVASNVFAKANFDAEHQIYPWLEYQLCNVFINGFIQHPDFVKKNEVDKLSLLIVLFSPLKMPINLETKSKEMLNTAIENTIKDNNESAFMSFINRGILRGTYSFKHQMNMLDIVLELPSIQNNLKQSVNYSSLKRKLETYIQEMLFDTAKSSIFSQKHEAQRKKESFDMSCSDVKDKVIAEIIDKTVSFIELTDKHGLREKIGNLKNMKVLHNRSFEDRNEIGPELIKQIESIDYNILWEAQHIKNNNQNEAIKNKKRYL